MRPIARRELLRERLGQLADSFDRSHLTPDPLELVLGYDEPLDQEVVGILAAAFAYGRAEIVVRNVGGVLDQMPASPWEYLLEDFDPREARERFRGFTHRFHKTEDLLALLSAISGTLRKYGSLGALFASVYDGEMIEQSLSRFVSTLIGETHDPRPSINYLLTDPSDGSACKRMNLFLRWMVRRTDPDLGLWTFVDPSHLVMPLDTHIHRIARFLGLHRRNAADWKAAMILTKKLKTFDPSDPVRYDFAICRLGILDRCSVKRNRENCESCMLNDVCLITKGLVARG